MRNNLNQAKKKSHKNTQGEINCTIDSRKTYYKDVLKNNLD